MIFKLVTKNYWFHEISHRYAHFFVVPFLTGKNITFWEIALKYSLNKLELEGITPDELPEFARKMNFELLSLNAAEAASFYHLPRITHKDPFDRMLIWQAIREKMVLISKDSKIEAYEDCGLKVLSLT
jgi:PIN domain nuclease of toxin-antitoxin system